MKCFNSFAVVGLATGLICVLTSLRYYPLLIIFGALTVIFGLETRITVVKERLFFYAIGFSILLVGYLVRGNIDDWIYLFGILWSILLYEKFACRNCNPKIIVYGALMIFLSLFLYPDYEYGRFKSYLYNPNALAQVAAMLCCFIWLFSNSFIVKLGVWIVSLTIFYLCESRQLLLFLLLYPLCIGIFTKKQGKVLFLGVCLFLLLYVGMFLSIDAEQSTEVAWLKNSAADVFVTTDGRNIFDANGRDRLAQQTFRSLCSNFWGIGFSAKIDPLTGEQYVATHNMFLDMIYRGGWLYFIWYVGFLLYIINKSEMVEVKAVLVAANMMLLFDNALPFAWSPGSAMAVLPYYLGEMALTKVRR